MPAITLDPEVVFLIFFHQSLSFLTLVIQGLSLPLLLEILKIKTQDIADADEHELRLSIDRLVSEVRA